MAVIMQKLNKQIKVDESDVEEMKARGYGIPDKNGKVSGDAKDKPDAKTKALEAKVTELTKTVEEQSADISLRDTKIYELEAKVTELTESAAGAAAGGAS